MVVRRTLVAGLRARFPTEVHGRQVLLPGWGVAGMLAQVSGVPFRDDREAPTAMKILTRLAFLGSLFLVPALLHAQGCVDSPECPTAILGVVGAAGATLYVRWRSR